MDTLSDAELAQSLQLQFDSESINKGGFSSPSSKKDGRRMSGPTGIVDERWELIDPHPDIRALFLQFNDQFFWGKLDGIEVKWSPRMTLCAGLCCYEGLGGLCSVRLSQPLLKLRPRKDLVETLLHEMIHALLFVTQNNKDHDGHGPEFCKHMNRINSTAGTNISIYHTFHDEVDLYRQHWWRCDGPCRQSKPYFGYVKRSMNRAPSSRDTWWGEHQRTCGGTYTKIKEPEGYGKKKGGKKNADEISSNSKGGKRKAEDKSPEDKDKPGAESMDIRNFVPFSGRGKTLGAVSSQPSTSSAPPRPSTIKNNGSLTNKGIHAKSRQTDSELRTKSGDGPPKSSISSYLSKNGTASGLPKLPSLNGDVKRNSGGIGSGISMKNAGSSVSTGDSVNGFKKPRFTPVVATASGHVLSKSADYHVIKSPPRSERAADGESSPKTKRRFIPVVSTVGTKEPKSMPKPLLVHSGSSSQASQRKPDKSVAGSSKSSDDRRATWSKESSGSSSGKQGSKKRARLVDLQTMFDSDSDEEESCRSPKVPRYSPSDVAPNRISGASDKENSNGAINNWSNDINIIQDGSSDDDDDDLPIVMISKVSSGIWKDLSHLTSNKHPDTVASDNGRFGRVPPPLWGKTGGRRVRGNESNTPPRSSFCEHPWQTAARETNGKRDGVIHLAAGDEDEEGQRNRSPAGSVSGPKTVPCPVCNLQIEEKKINQHLDTCLTYNSDALFPA